MSRSNQNNPEPAWTEFVSAHGPGDILSGRVTSIVSFGAFVEVAPGVDGLMHTSEWKDGVVPELEQTLSVRIQDIDVERHRLSLVPQ